MALLRRREQRNSKRRQAASASPRFEPLETRWLLNGALVDLSDDAFEAHQNSSPIQVDVLANDSFDEVYEGQQRITSVSYGSEGGTVEIASDGTHIRYAPPADFFGAETFVYFVDAAHRAQVEVTVQAPLAFDAFEIPPDGQQRQLRVMANDRFWPSYQGPRQITSVSVSSAGGTVEIDPDKQSVRYTPPEGSFGKDQFVYIVDGLYPAQVTISIPQTLESDDFEVIANTQHNVLRVLDNDPFWSRYGEYPGPRLITHVLDTDPQSTAEISSDGESVIYSPPPGRSGWDSFRYVVDAAYEAFVSVIIHRPVRDDSFEIDQNSTDQFLLLTGNDTYRDRRGITRDVVDRVTSISEPPGEGEAVIAAGGQGVYYTPPPGFFGTDTFTYLADGLHEAQVFVQVTRPVRDDYISQGVYQDTPGATLNVLANDFLGNGYSGPRRITDLGPTENGGQVHIAPFGGSLAYTPTDGFVGYDRFAYTVDEDLDANVTVSIQALAQNDYFSFCADPTRLVYPLNVLANDHFHRGYAGPGVITGVNEITSGAQVAIGEDGELLFTPGPGGWNRFGYTVDDQYDATVHVSITGHLNFDSFVIDQNSTGRALHVLDNDFSFDDRRTCKSRNYLGPRRISDVSQSQAGGIVTMAEDGQTASYRPPLDFFGQDSFVYTVDGLSQATVQLHVIRHVRDDQFRVDSDDGVESLPVLVNDLFAANYTGAQRITTVSQTSSGGTAQVGDDGRTVEYAPPTDFVGTDTFTYTVDDALKAEVSVIVQTSGDEKFPRFDTLADYQQFLIDDALVRYEHLFGQPAWSYRCLKCFDGAAPPEQGQDRSHSDTNVQVEGVDEGDIVEFDSDYVYVLTEDELVIVDAWPAQTLAVASRVDIEGTPIAEFLRGDRLTVISETASDIFPVLPGDFFGDFRAPLPPWPQPPASTIVTVLDVSDRTAPAVVQTTTMEGRHVESRAIGEYVYVLVRSDNAVAPPPLVITDDPEPADGADSGSPDGDTIRPPYPDGGVYETREAYLERFTTSPGEFIDEALPNYSSYGPDGDLVRTGLLNEPEGIFRPLLLDASHLTSVVSLRVTGNEPGLASTSGVYATGAGAVYASLENFYVFDSDYSQEDGALTRLMKFDWDGQTGGVEFVAAGVVPGSMLNQFSADETGDLLRIATTISNQWSGNFSGRPQNALFVLREDDGVFEFVGSLPNLALGETMRSIRYMGDRAFVTTFRTVDPLFGLDLSDPNQPRAIGHLTLPGFSSYMQLIDHDHLLTVGQNTPNGLQGPTAVSLFDVSNLQQPWLIDAYTFARFSTSEAQIDHHAFGYFAEHGLLAIPSSRGYFERVDTDGDGYRETRTWAQEEHLAILAINVAPSEGTDGIQLVGEIPHDTQVRRSGYIDDKLYSIANDSVKVVDVANPTEVIGAVVVVDESDPPAAAGTGDEIVVNYPATLSDGPLFDAVQMAQAHLADHMQMSEGASMLVTAETRPATGVSQIILRDAEGLYLYQVSEEGSVVLANSDYEFVDTTDRNGVWHAIAALTGDMNRNGVLENTDITLFIDALRAQGDEAAFLALHPHGDYQAADVTMDGNVNNADITPFVNLMRQFNAGSGAQVAGVAAVLATADRTAATNDASASALASGQEAQERVARWLESRLGRHSRGGFFDVSTNDTQVERWLSAG